MREVKLTCKGCGAEIFTETEVDLEDVATKKIVQMFSNQTKMLCRTCYKDSMNRGEQNRRWELSQEWNRICPSGFQLTKASDLPRPSLLMEVLRWQYCSNGLLLLGKTGGGKSRCAWKLCEREFLAGRTFSVMDATFGEEYAAKMRIGSDSCFLWLEEKAECDLLLMDDIFKIKLTDAAETALFTIIDARTKTQRPMIITTNDTGETLCSRMTQDRGPAIVRRLREFCKYIEF